MKEEVYRFDKRIESSLRHIENSDILKENKQKIFKFYHECIVRGYSKARILKYLSTLLSLAKLLGKPFVDAKKEDIVEVIAKIEQSNYSDWTKHDFKSILKVFFKWLRKTEDYPEEVVIALKHMFTSVFELPKEEEIEEQIHIPNEEVSIPKERSVLLDMLLSLLSPHILTSHAIIYGKTRVGKVFLSLILMEEALENGIKVIVFDPHGTLANKLRLNPLLKVNFTKGKVDISEDLEEIYDETSTWSETNELKLLIVLDETRLLKAKTLFTA